MDEDWNGVMVRWMERRGVRFFARSLTCSCGGSNWSWIGCACWSLVVASIKKMNSRRMRETSSKRTRMGLVVRRWGSPSLSGRKVWDNNCEKISRKVVGVGVGVGVVVVVAAGLFLFLVLGLDLDLVWSLFVLVCWGKNIVGMAAAMPSLPSPWAISASVVVDEPRQRMRRWSR